MSEAAIEQRASSGVRWPPKADVFGVRVSCVEYDAAVSCIVDAAGRHLPSVVACHAVHAIVTAGSDQSLREMVNRFSMITPDGQPVRWALNVLHGAQLSDRVYGPELMRRVCLAAADRGLSIYLYGGTAEILARLEANLLMHSPGTQIAGSAAPPFRELTDAENDEACRRINESGASIVMIGLGCPQQDLFAARNHERIDAVQMCVGAAFDFHAGVKPMAPPGCSGGGWSGCFVSGANRAGSGDGTWSRTSSSPASSRWRSPKHRSCDCEIAHRRDDSA